MLISKQGSIDNIFYCSNFHHKVPPFHTSMQTWLSNGSKHNYGLPWALFKYYENVWGIHTTNHMVTLQVYCAILYHIHGSRGYITIYCTPSDLHSFIILRLLIIYSHTVNEKGRRLYDNSKSSGQSLIFHDNYLCTECSHVHTVLILCSYQAELCTELLQLTSRGREVHVGQAHMHSAIWWWI